MFAERLASYSRQLGELLTESRWAFWRRSLWTYGHWARRDPELQKILARLYAATDELLRRQGLDEAGPHHGSRGVPSGGMPELHRRRVERFLEATPASLTLDSAIEVFDALDRILIEIGDARFVCEEIHGELQWAKGSTTWMTWDSMHGARTPKAVETYNSGKRVPDEELESARHQLASFRRARSDDYQVHRARLKMRAKNLRVLGALLLPLVVGVGWLLAEQDVGGERAGGIALIGVAGALGSAVSGTIKSRDKIVRGSDLRAFRAGLLAQVLIGAGSAFLFFLLLTSGILDIAGTGSLEGRAAVGFVAGFSEPFVLKTVERVARMGEERSDEDSTKAKKGDEQEAKEHSQDH